MNVVLSTVCVLLIGLVSSGKLPASFKKCNKNDPDFEKCLAEAIPSALSQLTKPFKEVGLPSIDPLEVPELIVSAGTKAVGIEQKFKNVKMYGFSKGQCTEVKVNFEKKTIYADCSYDKLVIDGDYNLSGKILLLDVHGNGKAKIVLDKVRAPATYSMEVYEKNGKKHWKVATLDITTEPQHVSFNFDNLYDGDKLLGDNINKVMNDNWKQVFEDLNPSYSKAFATISKTIFNQFLEKVSAFELFGDV